METKIKTKDVPIFMRYVSKKYWLNTITGKFVRAENLEKYLEDNRVKDTGLPVKLYWWNNKD